MMRPNIRRLDKAKRLAYFDEAAHYTPYVATQAGDALFLVKTEDKHIARSLFGKQSRGELAVLGRAAAAVRGLFGDAHVAERMFVDVGANIGTTSIPAVLSEGFASAVAIEPEPENVRVLRLNVLLNDLDERITVAAGGGVGRRGRVGARGHAGPRRQALASRQPNHSRAQALGP